METVKEIFARIKKLEKAIENKNILKASTNCACFLMLATKLTPINKNWIKKQNNSKPVPTTR